MKKTTNDLIFSDTAKHGLNFGISPLAPSTRLLQIGHEVEREEIKVRGFIDSNSEYPETFKALVSFMYVSGCRVSEVLSIESRDISPFHGVRIRGKKGSEDRYIVPAWYRDLWLKDRLKMPVYLSSISRFYVHRQFIRLGFYFVDESSGYKAVTHYFRNLYLKTLLLSDLSSEEKRKIIGHRNIKSQEYYGKENRKGV